MKPLQPLLLSARKNPPSAFQSRHSLHTGAIPTAYSTEGSTATRSRGAGPKGILFFKLLILPALISPLDKEFCSIYQSSAHKLFRARTWFWILEELETHRDSFPPLCLIYNPNSTEIFKTCRRITQCKAHFPP